MFDHIVTDTVTAEQAHSIRAGERYGPASDTIRDARRRPIRGFFRRLAARLHHRRPAPAARPQVGVGATQAGG